LQWTHRLDGPLHPTTPSLRHGESADTSAATRTGRQPSSPSSPTPTATTTQHSASRESDGDRRQTECSAGRPMKTPAQVMSTTVSTVMDRHDTSPKPARWPKPTGSTHSDPTRPTPTRRRTPSHGGGIQSTIHQDSGPVMSETACTVMNTHETPPKPGQPRKKSPDPTHPDSVEVPNTARRDADRPFGSPTWPRSAKNVEDPPAKSCHLKQITA
jgi:hypothetical protein